MGALVSGCVPGRAAPPVAVAAFETRVSEVVALNRPFAELAQALAARAPELDARVRSLEPTRLVLVVRDGGTKAVVDISEADGRARLKATFRGDSTSRIAHRVKRVFRELAAVASAQASTQGEPAPAPEAVEAAPAEAQPLPDPPSALDVAPKAPAGLPSTRK